MQRKSKLIHFRQPKCFGKCWSSVTGCKSCHSKMRFSETQGAHHWKVSWYSVAKCGRHTSASTEQFGCSSTRGTGGKKSLFTRDGNRQNGKKTLQVLLLFTGSLQKSIMIFFSPFAIYTCSTCLIWSRRCFKKRHMFLFTLHMKHRNC